MHIIIPFPIQLTERGQSGTGRSCYKHKMSSPMYMYVHIYIHTQTLYVHSASCKTQHE